MINFTTDFITAATSQIRDPRAMVEITWGLSQEDKNSAIDSSDENHVYRTPQIKNETETTGGNWAFIGNEFKLDGTFNPMPSSDDGEQVGWYGTAFSDSNGDFSRFRYIDIRHNARPYQNIKIVGDSVYSEYPVDFDVELFHSSGSTVVASETGNASRIYEVEFTAIPDVYKVFIRITKWSAPNTIIKIASITSTFTETLSMGDISELSILEETNSDIGNVPIGGLSANELDLALMNYDRRFSYGNTESKYSSVLESGKKIRVWLGFVLPSGSTDATDDVEGYIVETSGSDKIGYMPYGVFYSDKFNSSYGNMIASVNAYDLVYQLSKYDYVESVIYSGTASDLIDDIMAKAQEYIPNLEYEISTDISGETFAYGSIEKKSYLDAIKDICKATYSYAYINRFGKLIIGARLGASTPVSAHQKIGLDEYFEYNTEQNMNEFANIIRVGYTVLDQIGIQSQEIYSNSDEMEIQAGETSLRVFLDWSNPVFVSESVGVGYEIERITGSAVISETEDFSYGAYVTIVGNPGDKFKITATGFAFDILENTRTVAVDNDSVKKYGPKELFIGGNRLITSVSQAESLANAVLALYGTPRQDASIQWRGNTLGEIGDTLEVVEFKSATVETKDNFVIKRQNINFNGGLATETELRRG